MFKFQPRYIGVDIGKSSFRFVALRKTGRRWAVSSLKDVSNEDNVHLFYSQFKEDALVSAINTRDVLMRPCEIQLKKKKDIIAALDFHVEPLLPYPLDKAIIQAEITSHQGNTTFLNIFAIRKDHLSQNIAALKKQEVDPEIITTRPHALAAFSTLLSHASSPILIIHEGEEELSIVFVENEKVLAFRSIDNKKDLTNEIQKTLLSFASTLKGKPFESIYFLGKNGELKNLIQELSGKPALAPTSPYLALTQDEIIHFSIAIGAALSHKNINFRQKEFSYPNRFKRLKKPIATYFILSILLASTLCIFGEMFLLQKKQSIEKAYSSLLKSEKITPAHSTFQSPQDYLISLQTLEKQIRGRPETFPLLPQVPKVKEMLSWLTMLAMPQGNGISPITIESIHYQMIKRPSFSHKNEHYRVRVDLEFSAKDTNAARNFQDALKNSSLFIDSNEEIQWLSVKGKYKTAFFLKDKTKYV